MTKLAASVVLVVTMFLGVGSGEAAIYMLIPNISGETTESTHAGWVELQTLNWGHGEPPPGSAVKVQFNKVNGTKQLDSVSSALALLAANAQPLKEVKVEVVRTAAGTITVLYRLKLTNARLVNYAASVQSNQIGIETFSLEFDTISWISFKTTAAGTTSTPGTAGCWDVVGNKPCAPSF